MAPIKIAVVGAGMALRELHFPSIICQPDLYTLHSVVDRSNRGRVLEICGEGVKVVQSLDDVINDDEVELVVVASPNNTHFDYASRCLVAGKHVLVEKPICPTVEEAQKLVDSAKSKGLILSVYQNRRWDSDFLTVKKLLEEAKLGEINELQSSFDRYRPLPPPPSDTDQYRSPADGTPQARQWKETAGEHNDVIYNLGSHIIDQAYVLFGMPDRVGCRVWDQRRIGVDEAFVMDLYYPSPTPSSAPLIVTLRASVLSPLPRQLRFLVKGNKGAYTKYGGDPQVPYLQAITAGNRSLEGYGIEAESDWGEIAEAKELKESTTWDVYKIWAYGDRHPSEPGNWPYLYTNLYHAIRSDPSALEVKPEQAVDVLRLIELGLQASRKGRILNVTR